MARINAGTLFAISKGEKPRKSSSKSFDFGWAKSDDSLHSPTPTKWFAKVDPAKNAACTWPRRTGTAATSAK